MVLVIMKLSLSMLNFIKVRLQGLIHITYETELVLNMVKHTVYVDEVVIFLDDGSESSLIAHKTAKILGLRGEEMVQYMEVCGSAPELRETWLYNLTMTDIDGVKYHLKLIHIDKILRESLDRPIGEVSIINRS